ncbi:MAG: type I restriction endonuclease subunit R, partial [Chloroflexota bacterium]
PAPVVITKLQAGIVKLEQFMQSQGLAYTPAEVPNLKGDAARAVFINLFKEVQRFKTQLDQYTDLTVENTAAINQLLPEDQLQAFRGMYLELALGLKDTQGNGKDPVDPEVQQLDFEFVLFASAIIDYDYIMALIARYTQGKPGMQTMSREQLIGLIQSDAKLMDEHEDITAYITALPVGRALSEQAIGAGYQVFKTAKNAQQLSEIAAKHGLPGTALQTFIDGILQRMIFDGEQLSDLLAPLELGWKARTQKQQELMTDLIPHLHKLAQGREISGLKAYEQ